ncbi:MAG: hypothetical protein PHI35_04625 [Victivallaceae bacterium]|nr:hypothetical protein [Victivallaceae bacterium]
MAVRWIKVLSALQACDMRLRDLETRLASIPKEMAALKARRDKAVSETSASAEAARQFERAAKAAEAEIEKLNAESRKLEQQSALVKKNTEYQAMLNNIALNKSKISQLENVVLENLDRFEEGKKAYRKVRLENEAVAKAAHAEFDELAEFAKEVRSEVEKLKAERPSYVCEIDGEMLSSYTHLLNGKNSGMPLVAVDANGICGNCHMRVTPQALTNIKRGAVTHCDNCQHFIYSEDAVD